MSASQVMTITLPKYENFSESYDLTEFANVFPDSFIVADAMSNPDITIENPLVTPEVLDILQYILTQRDYPYIPMRIKTALEYLQVQVPSIVYDPRYDSFRKEYPNLHLLDQDDLEANYLLILQEARDLHFPELAMYLLDHLVNPEDQYQLFNDILRVFPPVHSETDEQIALAILQANPVFLSSGGFIDQAVRKGYLNLVKYLLEQDPKYIPRLRDIRSLITNIGWDPVHFNEYATMIRFTDSYYPRVSSYDINKSLINLFNNIYGGQSRGLTKLLRTVAPHLSVEKYRGLLWSAVITGHISNFYTILDTAKDHQMEDEVLSDFLLSYIKYPDTVDMEILRRIGDRLITRYQNRVALEMAVDRLRDYPELQEILKYTT